MAVEGPEGGKVMREYKVGEVFDVGDVVVKVTVIGNDCCDGCYGESVLCSHLPPCAPSERKDGLPVIFKEVSISNMSKLVQTLKFVK